MVRRIWILLLIVCNSMMLFAQQYHIGDVITNPDGSKGVVFYINQECTGGWMVRLTDDSGGCKWGTNGDIPGLSNYASPTTTQEQLIHLDGYQNTQIIRNYQNNNTTYAAGKVDFNHGWYLPSLGQLRILISKLGLIKSALTSNGGAILDNDKLYWSSTECSSSEAWCIKMSNSYNGAVSGGYFNKSSKSSNYAVRAIRDFTMTGGGADATYIWSENNVVIPNATDNEITVSPTETTTYSVEVSYGGSCSGGDEVTITVNQIPTGTHTVTICESELPYTWPEYNVTFETGGSQTVNVPSGTACDSLVTLVVNVDEILTGTHTVTICESELPYTWPEYNVIFETGGSQTVNVPSGTACDSLVTLVVNVDEILTGTHTVTICESELPYTWLGYNVTFESGGSQIVNVPSGTACDSLVTLVVNVDQIPTGTHTVTICESELPYTWPEYNVTFEAGGSQTINVSSGTACDSLVTLVVNVDEILTGTHTVTICESELPYTWPGYNVTFEAGGSQTINVSSGTACDSLVTLVVNVDEILTGTHTVTICESELPYTWPEYNVTFETGGSQTVNVQSGTACDSLVTLVVNVDQIPTGTHTVTICESELPYTWPGYNVTFEAGGSQTINVSSGTACDSLVTLVVNVDQILTGTHTVTICESELPYTWPDYNVTFDAGGSQTINVSSDTACDSLVTLVVNVDDILTGTHTVTICESELPYTWTEYGVTFETGGSQTVNVQSGTACDSLVTLVVNVDQIPTGTHTVTICESELPYTWPEYNVAFETGGSQTINVPSGTACDSLVTLVVNVEQILTDTHTVTICESELPYTWPGYNVTFEFVGSQIVNVPSGTACDSLVTLVVNVDQILTGTHTVTICESELPYTWPGYNVTFEDGGSQTVNVQSGTACDSLVTLVVNVDQILTGTHTVTICESELPYTWPEYNVTFEAGGSQTINVSSGTACDSLVTLVVNVDEILTGTHTVTICESELPYTWPNYNVTFEAGGSQTVNVPSGTACDSLVTLVVNVDQILTGTHTVTICESELPYTWPGYNVTFEDGGSQTVNVQSGTACDSLVTLVVNVDQILIGTHTVTICESELPYTWPGYNVTFESGGSQIVNVPSGTACDSLVTLVVNVDQILTGTHTVTICESELPYTWPEYNVTFETGGSQTVNVPSGTACDSLVTLVVNVDQILTGTHTVTICESERPYTWPGYNVTFEAGGSQTINVPSGTACDSLVTLVVNVDEILTGTHTVTICESEMPYTWPGYNVTFESGGSQIVNVPSGTACDSLVTLVVNVDEILTGTHTVTICESELPYTWTEYGVTFETGGCQTINVPSGTACDSLVTLVVNVDQLLTGTHTLTICESELPYTWPGYDVTFETGGSQTINVPSGTACDSLVTLVVNVDEILTGTHTVTVCESELPYIWPGYNVIFETGGSQTINVPSGTACDSLVTLVVNVDEILTGTHTVTICESDLPYTWLGYNVTFESGGSQTVNVPSGTACDSLVTLVVNVDEILTGTHTMTICETELPYTWPEYNVTFESGGSQTINVPSGTACDSLVTLVVNVDQIPTGTHTVTICESELPYTWPEYNVTFEAGGSQTINVSSGTACDSLVTLVVNVDEILTGTHTVTICESELPYTWPNYNVTFEAGGSQTVNVPSGTACDSLVTLVVNVDEILTGTHTMTICETELPYTWPEYNVTFESGGSQTINVPSGTACDSLVTLVVNVDEILTGTHTVTICESEMPYTWPEYNVTFEAGGSQTINVPSGTACDSLVTLVVNVDQILTGTHTVTICESDLPYTWPGYNVTFEAGGSQTINVPSGTACDSLVTLVVNVDQIPTGTHTVTICESELPYIWPEYNVTFEAGGSQTINVSSATACDSLVTLVVNVDQIPTGTHTVTICESELPYTWPEYNVAFETGGSQTINVPSGTACDSLVTLVVNVEQILTDTHTVTICESELPYTWPDYNVTFDAGGSQTINVSSDTACDSLVTLVVNVDEILTGTHTVTICESELPYTWPGYNVTFESGGSQIVNVPSATACDSLVTLVVNVDEMLTTNLEASICTGYNYTQNGFNIINPPIGVLYDTLYMTSVNDCDSTVYLELTVNDMITTNITDAICAGNDYTQHGFNIINPPIGIVYDTLYLTSVNECDSTVFLELTVNDIITTNLTDAICVGNDYTQHGFNIINPPIGVLYDTLYMTSVNDCDSTVYLELTVNDMITTNITDAICAGNDYTQHGFNIINPPIGVVYDTLYLTSVNECDSTVYLELTVNDIITTNLTDAICAGYNYTQNGFNIINPPIGVVYDTLYLTSVNDCDSTVYLELTVNDMIATNITDAICTGYDYNQNGFNIVNPPIGVVYDTLYLTSVNDCDSTVYLELTVNDMIATNITDAICTGYDYTQNGFNIVNPPIGVVYDTLYLTSVNDCDSTVYLELTVNDMIATNITDAICTGYDYTQNGFNIVNPPIGVVYDTLYLTSVNDCDSTVYLELIVNDMKTTNITDAICAGYDYIQNGFNIINPPIGIVYDTIFETSVLGCDSLVCLKLTVNDIITTNLTDAICFGNDYTENGFNIINPEIGIHSDTIFETSVMGCDSLVILTLTVKDLPLAYAGPDQTIPYNTSTTFTAADAGEGATYHWYPEFLIKEGQGTTMATTQQLTGDQQFYLTVGKDGCENLAIINVFVSNQLTATISADPDAVCPNESTSLTVNASGGSGEYTYTYLWEPSEFINGDNTSQQVTTMELTETTEFFCTVTDEYGESCTSNATVIVRQSINASITSPNYICKGESAVLTAKPDGMASYLWNTGETAQSITVRPDAETTYSVTMTSQYGCTGSAEHTLSVIPVLEFTSEIAGDTLAPISNIPVYNEHVYSVSPIAGCDDYCYTWRVIDNEDWQVIPNGNSCTVIVSSPGEYVLEVSVENECGSDFRQKTITGVQYSDGWPNTYVYPNPAKSYIEVMSLRITSVVIYNSIGMVVLKEDFTGENEIERVDITDLADGLYLVFVKNSLGIKYKRIIVEH